ncbi:MAG: hypothetical protein RMY34_05825 [Aulosira sp. DedQUE10]|nr:hypothetical protein [Aulosira sp. DedQUE10]
MHRTKATGSGFEGSSLIGKVSHLNFWYVGNCLAICQLRRAFRPADAPNVANDKAVSSIIGRSLPLHR